MYQVRLNKYNKNLSGCQKNKRICVITLQGSERNFTVSKRGNLNNNLHPLLSWFGWTPDLGSLFDIKQPKPLAWQVPRRSPCRRSRWSHPARCVVSWLNSCWHDLVGTPCSARAQCNVSAALGEEIFKYRTSYEPRTCPKIAVTTWTSYKTLESSFPGANRGWRATR